MWTRTLRRLVLIGTALFLGSLAFGIAAEAQTTNQTMVVNSTGDQDDNNVRDGVCSTSGGTCTLRAAITQANNNLGPDTVHFNIPGGGVHTINLGSELPPINDISGPVTIDGYTEPGAAPNTHQVNFNADIRIQIDGDDEQWVFRIQSPGNTIRGLSFYNAAAKIELFGENADGNRIVGNLIGTNVANTFSENSGDGVSINLGPDQNIIGTPALADRNVISGSGQYGIRINHGETSRNVIQNNIIGLGADGRTDLGATNNGIDIQWWTWGNLVGGTGTREHNVIAGNRFGLDLSHAATGNNVIGNLFGVHPDGSTSNASSQTRSVQLKDNPSNNYIAHNLITNNTENGIYHRHNYTPRNTFAFNTITDNDDYGIILTGVDDIYYDNIIANNGRGPIQINNNFGPNGLNAPDQDFTTANNSFRLGHLHGNGGPVFTDIDNDVHQSTERPTLTGIEIGAVYGNDSCGGCDVDIWASGTVNADNTVSVGSTGGGSNGGGANGSTLVALVSGLCVEVPNNSQQNGVGLVQQPCDGGANQNFEQSPSGNGFNLIVSHSGKCVEVAGNNTSNSADIVQATCDGGANQRLEWVGQTLVFDHSNDCFDIDRGSTAAGTPAEQNACTGQLRQRFELGGSSGSNGTNAWTWLGTVRANNAGVFSMAHNDLEPGVTVWAVSLTQAGETSEASNQLTVGSNPQNPGSNPSNPRPAPSAPAGNPLPPPYQPVVFECSYNNGTLGWSDAGASAYFVFATNGGNESYLGERQGTNTNTAGADSYRVTHWAGGFPTTALCDGPGQTAPTTFECSYSNGTVTWTDQSASNYFIRSVTNGVDTFLGSSTTLSFGVAGADTYRVIHWLGGQNIAECDGPGQTVSNGLECNYNNGTLSWTNVGAPAYFIRSVTGGVDTYLGAESANSFSRSVEAADTYRVIHWLSGSQTVAECDGPGPDAGFSCSVSGTTLTWDDDGANAYFVFAEYDNADDVYLGGHSGTSLTVPAADSYRVTHWLGGQTVATCSP